MRFEWHAQKARVNARKHRVYFEEAATIFADANVLTMHDSDHSASEDRWISLGCSETGRLLVVIHTWPEQDASGEELVRIISARKANRRESLTYSDWRKV